MKKVQVFVDSDVIISSLISHRGAAYLLLNSDKIEGVISNFSKKELKKVAEKLNIEQDKLNKLIADRLKVVKLKSTISKIKLEFEKYTNDLNDAHIVAGAKQAKTKFLITYNLKDYKKEDIKQDFGIMVITPAIFLQYLRAKN